MKLATRIKTYQALGVGNLLRVAAYRLGLRTGWHPVQRVRARVPAGPFFRAQQRKGCNLPEADDSWLRSVRYFDWLETPLPPSGIPDWHANPFGAHQGAQADKPWWTIGDFEAGDIKGVWELSRFGWAVALAGSAALGNVSAGDQLNRWIEDWSSANPPYRGPNWKCGQEASIRVMHLIAAAISLDEDRSPLPGLVDLVRAHLSRIAPTINYALAQDNNHGTSEAAALFCGGHFLAAAGDPQALKWARQGRRWLEERAQRLIGADGSFSQYSVNYHRLMLDSYSLAETCRRRWSLADFSGALLSRLKAATLWLHAMVDPASGDAPNIGASDGARLFPIQASGYRDFRPSVQWAAFVFAGECAYEAGSCDSTAFWLGLERPSSRLADPVSRSFDDGGWHVLIAGQAKAIMRYPRFAFRPSHADALHLDLWLNGQNLLLDCGSLSYNDSVDREADHSGVAFHNTGCFDGAEPMLRVSRFLFGDWLKTDKVGLEFDHDGTVRAFASYRARSGAQHQRSIMLRPGELRCIDRADGEFGEAVFRWHLPEGPWRIEDGTITGESLTARFEADIGFAMSTRVGRRAAHYQKATSCFVIEVRTAAPGEIRSVFTFNDI